MNARHALGVRGLRIASLELVDVDPGAVEEDPDDLGGKVAEVAWEVPSAALHLGKLGLVDGLRRLDLRAEALFAVRVNVVNVLA
jgi:hypothetical protein